MVYGPRTAADSARSPANPAISGYFRCTPYFRAPEGPHDWLNRTVIVGAGERHQAPDCTRCSSITRQLAIRADYIVVGGGSAGCVLAARLTEDPRTRVVLLEAGESDVGRWAMRMPLAWRDTFMDPRLSWGYVTEPEPYADNRVIPVPRGKVLGGSASVNGMMYSR